MKNFARLFAISLLLLDPRTGLAQSSQLSATFTNLPALDGSGYQVNGLNSAGQLTGHFYIAGVHGSHAFVYSAGNLLDADTLGGSSSDGLAINSSGWIVGESLIADDAASHAFAFDGTTLFNLGTLGGSSSSAYAINDSGQVAGASSFADDLGMDAGTEAFLYTNGVMVGLGTLGGSYSGAFALNNPGVAIGASSLANGEFHGFVYANGTMTDIGTLGGNGSSAFVLNNSGLVAGESFLADGSTHGFVYSAGTMTDVGTLGGSYSTAYLINNSNQVAGVASTEGEAQYLGFLYSNGAKTDIGTLGGTFSVPYAMNNFAQIVGRADTADGTVHAFLWQKGTMSDLNSLLPTNSNWELNTAMFINDLGRIVGVGSHDGLSDWFIMDLVQANHPPIAVAGPNQTVDCQTQVTLDGGHSSDPDGDPLMFEWSAAGYVLGTNSILQGFFAMGTNVVTLRVTDPSGASDLASTLVVVQDMTPPEILSVPGPITVSADGNCQGVVPDVLGSVSASDNCTPASQLIKQQNPAAGTVLAKGSYNIAISVQDAAGNTTTGQVSLQVADVTAPVILSVPGPIAVSVGANCQAGVVPDVLGSVSASDNCTPASQLVKQQSPAAGTVLAKGNYTIAVTVQDAAGNTAAAQVSLQVADITAPVFLSVPGHITVSADANCQGVVPNVLGSVIVSDNCTPASQLVKQQSPAAGTVLAKGDHIITVSVQDAAGNIATGRLVLQVVDTTAPVILSVPGPITVSADGNCQGVVPDVLGNVTASDNCTPAGELVKQQSPAAGTVLAKGKYIITVSVKDAAGNIATRQVSLRVVDSTPPVILAVPGPITVSADANCQGVVPDVLGSVSASDNCTPAGELVKHQSPAAGTVLNKGRHTITVVVKDAAGNRATQTVAFTIADTTAPVIQSVTASPNVISPPNHQMVTVTVSVVASDNCDGSPNSKIISITCNEQASAAEMKITGKLTAKLAATRNNGSRIYTITVQCTDAAGNSATRTVAVTVPQGNGKK